MSARRNAISTRATVRRRRSVTMLTVIGLATAGLISASPSALAVHDLQMQLDGNTTVDRSPQPYDWESFFQAGANGTGGDITPRSAALPAGFVARGSTADYALPDVTTFATGSKDTLDIANGGWQCGKSNNLSAKDDLVNVYVTAYRNPANNHLLVYFGAEKSSNLGDNNIGIWFVQDPSVGCVVPASGKNTDWMGKHTDGDVLLTAAFTSGGTVATVESHVWSHGALGSADGGGVLCGGSAPETQAGAFACAITNTGDVNPPWNHPVKTAGTDGASLAPQEFYEGGIDVTQAELNQHVPGDPCITTFVADTRSSQSPTATLFDYAAGTFPVCHPATSLTLSRSPATIHSGDPVTWTAVETNTGTSPINNVTVTDTATTGACSPFTYVSGDVNNNGILDPGPNNVGESWRFTCTQAVTASKTMSVYGSGTDTISGKTIAGGPASKCAFDANGNVTFAAADYVCDPNERAEASVTVIHPSTTLTNTAATVSPSIAHAGDTVTYTFYEKNDGDVALTSPHITTDDTSCASLTTPVSGDSNGNGVLDVNEEWAFRCATSYTSTGTQTIHAIGHGTDPLGADVTYYQVSGSDCTAGAIVGGKLCDLQERTSQSVTIINPGTTLREAISAVVTFTYTEKNVGDSAISNPYVTSDCTGVDANNVPVHATYVSGDANANGLLDVGETWTLRCTKTVSLPLTSASTAFTDTGTGHGTDAAGSSVPTTNEVDSSSVTLTNSDPNTAQ